MREMMTEKELSNLPRGNRVDNTWTYHRDLGYGDHLERYGEVKTIEDYCKYAQVVNYDQYRGLMEGWASHLWEWYTGILIWKTQNPWTSLRGQMYDWFLDVNASFYGVKKGCEPLHPQYNIVTKQVELVNTALTGHNVTVKAQLYNTNGSVVFEKEESAAIATNSTKRLFDIPKPAGVEGVYFLKLTLLESGKFITDNIYWLTTKPNDYTGLTGLPKANSVIKTALNQMGNSYTGTVTILSEKNISFFNRVKVFDKNSGKRILPVHYSDNYVTLMPGDSKEIGLEFTSSLPKEQIEIVVESWTDAKL
jgi:hypothetical protein